MGGAQSNYNSSKFRRMAASSLCPYCESTGINGTLVGNNLDSLPKLSDSRALVNIMNLVCSGRNIASAGRV